MRVVEVDVLDFRPPRQPFRVIGNLPFAATTAILRHLLDDPSTPLTRADLVVQWEVARKRAQRPPTTLLSTTWAPYWEFRLGRRVAAASFRPRPGIDAGMLTVLRRNRPLLPLRLARPYAAFVRDHWSA